MKPGRRKLEEEGLTRWVVAGEHGGVSLKARTDGTVAGLAVHAARRPAAPGWHLHECPVLPGEHWTDEPDVTGGMLVAVASKGSEARLWALLEARYISGMHQARPEW